jgi:hypothetical protein
MDGGLGGRGRTYYDLGMNILYIPTNNKSHGWFTVALEAKLS